MGWWAGLRQERKSLSMNSEERRKVEHHLSLVIENLEIHHQRRDGDWLRPSDLRQILRLMYYLVVNITDPWEDLPSD